jgi:hypothetical protein
MTRWLITLVIVMVCAEVHAADIVECEYTRVYDGRYWAYRMIDGKQCWYPGARWKPKYELRWSRPSREERTSGAARPQEPISQPHGTPAAVPVISPTMEVKEVMQHNSSRSGDSSHNARPAPSKEELTERAVLTADRLLAFTCCWPEFEFVPLPQARPKPTLPKQPPLWFIVLVFSMPLLAAATVYYNHRRS